MPQLPCLLAAGPSGSRDGARPIKPEPDLEPAALSRLGPSARPDPGRAGGAELRAAMRGPGTGSAHRTPEVAPPLGHMHSRALPCRSAGDLSTCGRVQRAWIPTRTLGIRRRRRAVLGFRRELFRKFGSSQPNRHHGRAASMLWPSLGTGKPRNAPAIRYAVPPIPPVPPGRSSREPTAHIGLHRRIRGRTPGSVGFEVQPT